MCRYFQKPHNHLNILGLYANKHRCQLQILHITNVGKNKVQGGSNMTGTDLCVNKPHCAAAVRP